MTAAVAVPKLESERDAADARFWFGIGHGHGFDAGWAAGRDAEREAWNRIIAAFREVTSRPPLGQQQLPETAAPCSARCRECSRCTRYIAAYRNRRTHGDDDFPGGRVPAW